MWDTIKTGGRVSFRLVWLGGELAWAAIYYVPAVAMQAPASRAQARAGWLQVSARRLLNVFGVDLHVSGMAPGCGLLVSNHLSYLDILVLGAISPSVFVAKQDLKSWPLLGPLMRLAGTIFVDRNRKRPVGETSSRITQATRESLVVLFPEGTSSGGESVLPFRSSLLEAAADGRCRLTAAWLRYELEDGVASEEVCYWKGMTFVPHLLNLLRKRQVKAWASLKPVTIRADRKQLAVALRNEVLTLRHSAEAKAARRRAADDISASNLNPEWATAHPGSAVASFSES